jgi:hypothetical protein
MSGRFSRRNPAMVELSNDQVALIDSIALEHYGCPRKSLVEELLRRALPLLLEELERDRPGIVKKIQRSAKILRGRVERSDLKIVKGTPGPLPTGVVDLAQRREARRRAREHERS